MIADPGVGGFFQGAGSPPAILQAPFWRPIVEPMLYPSPLPGTLADALGDDYRLAYSGAVPGHWDVQVYLRVAGR